MNKNRNENEVVNDNNKKKEFDFRNFNDNVTPNLSLGRNTNDLMLRWKKIKSHTNHFKYFLLNK